jgi:hypothetical protein
MVGRYLDRSRERVVQMGECHFVLGSYLLTNDDFVDVVEFVPILIIRLHVSVPRYSMSHVEDF